MSCCADFHELKTRLSQVASSFSSSKAFLLATRARSTLGVNTILKTLRFTIKMRQNPKPQRTKWTSTLRHPLLRMESGQGRAKPCLSATRKKQQSRSRWMPMHCTQYFGRCKRASTSPRNSSRQPISASSRPRFRLLWRHSKRDLCSRSRNLQNRLRRASGGSKERGALRLMRLSIRLIRNI